MHNQGDGVRFGQGGEVHEGAHPQEAGQREGGLVDVHHRPALRNGHHARRGWLMGRIGPRIRSVCHCVCGAVVSGSRPRV